MTLIEFLRARLDEDARVARAATRWSDDPAVWLGGDGMAEELAHVTRHGPAQVLREVQMFRAILDDHDLLDPPIDPDDEDWPYVCRRCEDRSRHDAMRWPCTTLRLLAAAYDQHPDYRQEWAP